MKEFDYNKMNEYERKAFDKLRKQQGKAIITDFLTNKESTQLNGIELIVNIKDSNIVYMTDFVPDHKSINDLESIKRLVTDVQEQKGQYDNTYTTIYKFESNIEKVRFLIEHLSKGIYGEFKKGHYNEFLEEQIEEIYL